MYEFEGWLAKHFYHNNIFYFWATYECVTACVQDFFPKFSQLGVYEYIIKALHHLCCSAVNEINIRFYLR